MDKIFSHSTIIAFFITLSIYILGGYTLMNLLKNFDINSEKSIKIDLNLIDISLETASNPNPESVAKENLIPAANEIEPIIEPEQIVEAIIEEPKPILKEPEPKERSKNQSLKNRLSQKRG